MANGEISLTITKKEDGTSYVKNQYYKLPLQVMPAFTGDEDGTAFLYLLNPSGGMLSNDEFVIDINIETGAKANISTPSCNKIYHKKASETAKQSTHICVGQGAQLEYLPEGVIPFKASKYRQENEIRIDKSSKLIYWDIMAAGRVSRQEIFQFEKYSSETRIYLNDQLVILDCMNISPEEENYNNHLCMGENYFVCTIYAYDEDMNETAVDLVKEAFHCDMNSGITSPEKGMLVAKIVATHMYELEEKSNFLLSLIRKEILGKDIGPRRK